MQTHVGQLTKQRLSDFFVKEDGHVAHKNALVAGTVATGAILASLMLTPDAEACIQTECPDSSRKCTAPKFCCSELVEGGNHLRYWCSTSC